MQLLLEVRVTAGGTWQLSEVILKVAALKRSLLELPVRDGRREREDCEVTGAVWPGGVG